MFRPPRPPAAWTAWSLRISPAGAPLNSFDSDRAASRSRSRYRPVRRGSPRSSRRRIPAPRADSRFLRQSIRRQGAAAAARTALDRVHANRNEFILHFDVDVIENFQATNYPGSGGLTFEDVRAALEVFIVEPRLVAITVAAYNPEKDPDSSGAKQIIELLASVLALRRQALAKPASEPVAAAAAVGVASPREHEPETRARRSRSRCVRGVAASFAPGEAWTSDSLEKIRSRNSRSAHR